MKTFATVEVNSLFSAWLGPLTSLLKFAETLFEVDQIYIEWDFILQEN